MDVPSAVWGNASCFGTDTEGASAASAAYEFCCLGGLELFDSATGVCRSGCELRSCWSRDTSYETCCQARNLHLRSHTCLKGCESAQWLDFLRVFKLARGCIHCIGQYDLLGKVWGMIGAGLGCRAGEVLAAFTVLIASAVSSASSVPVRLFAPRAASMLEQISSCGLSSLDWWHLAGITDRQMHYILVQMEPVPFLGSSLRKERQNFTAIDVGAGGFGDTLYFLSVFQRVLAIDARPSLDTRQPWMKRVGRRLETLVRAVTGRSGEEVPVFLDQHGQGLMSSLNSSLVPGVQLHPLQQTRVSSVSCADLYENHSNVLYMKVDIEGFDIDCLRSLARFDPARLPRFFCIELPSAQSVVLDLVQHLGYQHFKISRQRLYNLRLARGERYAASGPFGAEAVDLRRGPRWRGAAEITQVLKLVAWERRRLLEWFDLHAAKST